MNRKSVLLIMLGVREVFLFILGCVFRFLLAGLVLLSLVEVWGCNKATAPPVLRIEKAFAGPIELSASVTSTGVPIDAPITLEFSLPVVAEAPEDQIQLLSGSDKVPVQYAVSDLDRVVTLQPEAPLQYDTEYTLVVESTLKGAKGETFSGSQIKFKTISGAIKITSMKIGDVLVGTDRVINVPLTLSIDISFDKPLNPATVSKQNISVSTNNILIPIAITVDQTNKRILITSNQSLGNLLKYQLSMSGQISGQGKESFQPVTQIFYSTTDGIPKLPVISDDELLTLTQRQTFKYFYDFAHPVSGMARERNTSGDIVTSGGSGFGLMALVVGIERGFITRTQGIQQLTKIITYLERADRFHGAWSHWIDGNTGKVVPFSPKDDGGDLVETSFLAQGLLTVRQYLNPGDALESPLIARINMLWQGIEWDWYRKNNEQVLYWHWSPNFAWDMNFALSGYFEEQITYFLAAASPTHAIPKSVYSNGYAKNGTIATGNTYYNIKLPLGSPSPLFWVQYSYLGLDPHFSDDYANYWTQNVNATLINRVYCTLNPKKYPGYSDQCWGLTASDNSEGYNAHSPTNDLGVITPTAALSSFPYTPEESMKALKFFYYNMGDRLWGQYGFYDSFDISKQWVANSYLAIDQGPIIVMIENQRTGLLWKLFMSAPEVQSAANKLNFRY